LEDKRSDGWMMWIGTEKEMREGTGGDWLRNKDECVRLLRKARAHPGLSSK
jgi:hypothetical protein